MLFISIFATCFPDMEILDVMPFRITRNAEVEREEDDAEDLLEMIAEELKQRRFWGKLLGLKHGPKSRSVDASIFDRRTRAHGRRCVRGEGAL
jgi:polyphosphate kinase